MTKGREGMPCTCASGLTCLESQRVLPLNSIILAHLVPLFFRNIHAKAGEEENRHRKRNIPDAYSTFLALMLRVA